LLGDLKKVHKYKDTSEDWSEFSKLLKRLIRDALRLRASKTDMEPSKYAGKRARIEQRLTKLLAMEWKNVEAKRLVKRLKRHRAEVLVFLYRDDVPSDNNFAERVIRNGVVMRKNSYCNRSLKGAKTQAQLMSVFATLKQRGFTGTAVIVKAIREKITTGKLPKLPKKGQKTE
jgi:transposase